MTKVIDTRYEKGGMTSVSYYAKAWIEETYDTYFNDVYQFVYFQLFDEKEAEDITHDTFVEAYHYYDRFEGNCSLKTWLFRLARNNVIDYKRKKRPLQWMMDDILQLQLKAKDYVPDDCFQLNERQRELYEALQKLKTTYQMVIYFRKIKEMSITETAIILNCSESKVKSTLHRALRALKKQMETEGYIHENA